MPVPDKYDEAIAELLTVDEQNWEVVIGDAWGYPRREGPGCLFQVAGVMGLVDDGAKVCGCLTQIRSDPNYYGAATMDLTNEIAADDRIPCNPYDITPEDLPVFAEWQRKIDAMGVR
jgi:hypothetical protein